MLKECYLTVALPFLISFWVADKQALKRFAVKWNQRIKICVTAKGLGSCYDGADKY